MNKRVVLATFLSVSLLSADTLVLRSGSRVSGSYMGGDSRSIRFAVGSQVNTYNLGDVRNIDFEGGFSNNSSDNSAQPNYGNSGNSGSYSAQPAYGASRNSGDYPSRDNAQQNSGYSGAQVPAGTEVVVRLIDPVNSETDRLGQTYRASVDQPVIVNGQTVIPRGADCVATLIDAEHSGRIEGKTSLTIDLKTININGRDYDLATSNVTEASGSRGNRSAKVIGGTAALGAIIGAIAGGGRGAAIGTVAGAGAGTAAQVATSGQKVRIPSETRLTFSLQNPINL